MKKCQIKHTRNAKQKVPNKIKFKEGQEVTWAGMKFKYVGLSEKSPDGNDRRVILKREGIKPVYEVLETEVNAN